MERTPAVTIVYFVRHAEPDLSIKDELLRPLSSNGLNQAANLVQSFSGVNVARVYTSPALRARTTVEPLATARSLNFHVLGGFRERSTGTWVEDFPSYSRQQWADFDYALETGESLAETLKRNLAALQYVLDESKGQVAVVGTHGTALSTIIDHFTGDFGYSGFYSIARIMPLVVEFRFEGTGYIGHHIFMDSNLPRWRIPVFEDRPRLP